MSSKTKPGEPATLSRAEAEELSARLRDWVDARPVEALESAYRADVAAFGSFVRHGGCWAYASMVARWVEPGVGQGAQNLGPRSGKVSATAFAADAQVSRKTVVRYLRAWDAAAREGHVPSSASILPGEHVELGVDTLPEWSDYYRAANSAGPADAPQAQRPTGNGALPPLPSALRIQFFKRFSRAIEVTRYQPEMVVDLLGDNEDDYVHIEQQVSILAQWLNDIEAHRLTRIAVAA